MNFILLTFLMFLAQTQGGATSQGLSSCRTVNYHVQTLHQYNIPELKPSSAVDMDTLKKTMQNLQDKQRQYDIARDCQDLKNMKYGNGYYKIDVDGTEGIPSFKVFCDMSPSRASIIIEHNYPNKTEVINAGNNPNGKKYNITYPDISESQLIGLIERKICSQSLRYDCHGAFISHDDGKLWAYWEDRNGNKISYWPGGKDYGCACGITKTCAGGPTDRCECEKNDYVWRHDEGTITEDRRLPVTRLYFSDTDHFNEKGHFTLGPLICY